MVSEERAETERESYELERIPGDGDLTRAYEVRYAVFVDEQGVPRELEVDEFDEQTTHFLLVDESGTAIGTARLRIPEAGVAKPERVAVRKQHRGEGLGRRLMDAVESEAREQGCSRAILHAQTAVEEFYRSLGYETTSDEFDEAGILHVKMEKEL